MSASQQISLEAKTTANPIVYALAKKHDLSLSKGIVADVVKDNINDLIWL